MSNSTALLARRGNVLIVLLLLLAMQQLAQAGMIKAKAHLAPLLIERAWAASLSLGNGAPVKPWPWADTWPVARLQLPDYGVDQLVLAGDSGNVLAFGPGHTLASAPLGSAGLAVIGGHRDTHFAFAGRVQTGAEIRLQLATGEQRLYEVGAVGVVDSRRQPLAPAESAAGLLLVTCYPFDALAVGGPLRYLIEARPYGIWPIEL